MYEELILNILPPYYVADLNKDYCIICQKNLFKCQEQLSISKSLCCLFLDSKEKANESFLLFLNSCLGGVVRNIHILFNHILYL